MTRRYLARLTTIVLLLAGMSFAQQTPAAQAGKTTAQKNPAAAVTKRSAQAEPWKKIPIPPLPKFAPAVPKRVELPNGMVIFLQEDHELPLISVVARIRGGSTRELAGKVGLIDIYGDVWRTGGTKTKTGDQLDDFLEARAAKVETGGGDDSTSISLNCLKQDFDDVFGVFVDLLRNPEFREDKIDLAKKQENTGIARRNDNISEIASREAEMLAYGKNNPYARIPEYATVAAIDRQDLLNWHEKYVHPNNILLGVVGDFDANAMEAKLKEAFESWQKGPAVEPLNVTFNEPKPGYYFIEKSDVNQSSIQMVQLGIKRDNPDYFAVTVMNEVFGGGFSSRLFQTIRTKLGLAYAVGGGIGSSFDHPGIFRIAMGTKIENTDQAVKALNQQLAELVKTPPTAEELKLAKDSILNSFIFNFDTPSKVLRERMAYEFYGYPSDFLERYRAGIEKVTPADVERVAQKYVHPDQFATLVVGTDQAGKRVADLGPVTNIDITIPTPGERTAAKPAATTPEAMKLMEKVATAMGGMEKLQSIKAIKETTASTVKTPQGELAISGEGLVELPDHMYQKLSTPMGEMTTVVSPQNCFMAMMGQVRDLPASQKAEALKALKRDPLILAQHINDPKFSFSLAGTEKVGQIEAQVVDVNADGVSLKMFVDPQTGHVVRESYQSITPTGPGEVVVDYADWKDMGGLTLPTSKVSSHNGQQVSKEQIQNVEINPAVDPKLFEKPAPAAPPAG